MAIIILEERLTNKVKHRTQIKLKVIVNDTLINNINDKNSFELLNLLIEHKYNVSNNSSDYNATRIFWNKIFDTLPVVVLDNRIKTGTYHIIHNLYLVVRSSKRFTEQVIELIYKL